MKISKIVIKDIEIILSDEEAHEQHEHHEHKCKCSKGEDSFLNSLSSMVEVFSETITDYLKEELSVKKKPEKEEVKKKMNDVEEKTSKVHEIPAIREVKKEEISKPIFEKSEPKVVEAEKVEEIEKVSKPEDKKKTDEKKSDEKKSDEKKSDDPRKNLLNNINPSSDLNDFIKKILNNMPDK